MKHLLATFILLLCSAFAKTSQANGKADVLIRVDDVGMSHSVNTATADFIKTGIPFSASIMVPTPWFNEAVEILKDKKHVAVGLHLTLTAEFRQYKWGPVAGISKVPSLVTPQGYFPTSVRDFLLSDYRLTDIETEIRAQIQKALNAGLTVSYVDHHMGIARATPEIAAVIEKVAAEFDIAVSRYFNEKSHSLFFVPATEKKQAFLTRLKSLKPGRLHLFSMHPGRDTPELKTLMDMNSSAMMNKKTGESEMFKHRAAELSVLTSPRLLSLKNTINFLNYNHVIQRYGLAEQKRNGILYTSRQHAASVVKDYPVVNYPLQ